MPITETQTSVTNERIGVRGSIFVCSPDEPFDSQLTATVAHVTYDADGDVSNAVDLASATVLVWDRDGTDNEDMFLENFDDHSGDTHAISMLLLENLDAATSDFSDPSADRFVVIDHVRAERDDVDLGMLVHAAAHAVHMAGGHVLGSMVLALASDAELGADYIAADSVIFEAIGLTRINGTNLFVSFYEGNDASELLEAALGRDQL